MAPKLEALPIISKIKASPDPISDSVHSWEPSMGALKSQCQFIVDFSSQWKFVNRRQISCQVTQFTIIFSRQQLGNPLLSLEQYSDDELDEGSSEGCSRAVTGGASVDIDEEGQIAAQEETEKGEISHGQEPVGQCQCSLKINQGCRVATLNYTLYSSFKSFYLTLRMQPKGKQRY
ncbi:hypothetical protein OROMI_006420 [Orobanche minor]